ncbi:MAG: flagellar hook-length control protein FliK [Rhodobacteraceae bacterium]|nr:flagellar hook-length control protein FliK [Paracoccaceae bacterium]
MQEMQFLNSDFQATDVAGTQLRSASGSVSRAASTGGMVSARAVLNDSPTTQTTDQNGQMSFEDVFSRENSESDSVPKAEGQIASVKDVKRASTAISQAMVRYEKQGQSALQNMFGAQQDVDRDGTLQPKAINEAALETAAEAGDQTGEEEKTFDPDPDVAELILSEPVVQPTEVQTHASESGENTTDAAQRIPEVILSSMASKEAADDNTVSPEALGSKIDLGAPTSVARQRISTLGVSAIVSQAPLDAGVDIAVPSETADLEAIKANRPLTEAGVMKPDFASTAMASQDENTMNASLSLTAERKETTVQEVFAKPGAVNDSGPSTASEVKAAAVAMQHFFEPSRQATTSEVSVADLPNEAMKRASDPTISMLEKGHLAQDIKASESTPKEAMVHVVSKSAREMMIGIANDAKNQDVKETSLPSDAKTNEAGNEDPIELRGETASKALDVKSDPKTAPLSDQSAELQDVQQEVSQGKDVQERSESSEQPAQRKSETKNVSEMNTVSEISASARESVASLDEKPEGLENLDELTGMSGTTREHQIARDIASPTSATNRIDLPNRTAMQLADVARQLPDRPVEITLTPEELGKVRLSFHVSENGAMQVVIATERPETLDLLRRNIDSLAAEFKDLGYSDSGFSFESFDQGAQNSDSPGFGEFDGFGSTDLSEDTMTATPEPVRLNLGETSGMDLRL